MCATEIRKTKIDSFCLELNTRASVVTKRVCSNTIIDLFQKVLRGF